MPKPTYQPKHELTPEQYNICFLKGTEPPFSGKYVNNHEPGIYECVSCGTPLFSSDAKYDSNSGWPSFFMPLSDERIKFVRDLTHGMDRIEIQCHVCGAHLGHVFGDGPEPTGKRFCVNSLSLHFVPKK